MKRFLVMLAMTATIVTSLSSCSKEGVKRFNGNYSFKTSGSVELAISGLEAYGSQSVSLTTEQGQLNIVTTDKSDGEMMVAMNILGGDVITFNAKADGKTLTVEPFTRPLTLIVGSSLTDLTATGTVTVSGTAERYEDIIIFDLNYEGGFTHQNTDYVIVSSDVQCWAKSID